MSGKGLTQEDFRKLLSTPRAPSISEDRPQATSSHSKKGNDGFAVPNLPKKDSNQRHFKPRELSKTNKAKEPETPRYRDRAEERRKGENKDYEESEAILAALNQDNASVIAPVLASDLADESATGPGNLSYEQSKYLGGDVAHTHLVKGLDYSLLEKMRKELKSTQTPAIDDDEQEIERLAPEEKEAIRKIRADTDKKVKFNSIFAEKIHQYAMQKREVPPKNELFAKGRMAWVFNMDRTDGNDPYEVPTTVIRSKFDVVGFQVINHW
ncbi:RED-like protein N-terminal region-domain-containing protein [Paraphysoderma sedebokerense]|nr:RED-like protein N-terminal region-domain-containing protein [Paraphysoderma sedebokerense]